MKIPSEQQAKYHELPFTKKDLLISPIEQFRVWYQQAISQQEIEPSAMSFATVNAAYEVSARMLLLKDFDEDGFVFFSNYNSRKAKALSEVSNAAMVFWWPLCQRQVRITGKVVFLDSKRSDLYFATRDKGSQISALASKQSEEIVNREALINRVESLTLDFTNTPTLPRPDYWGGYVLQPQTLEFWQGRNHRLHDRFEYRKIEGNWEIVQLSP